MLVCPCTLYNADSVAKHHVAWQGIFFFVPERKNSVLCNFPLWAIPESHFKERKHTSNEISKARAYLQCMH